MRFGEKLGKRLRADDVIALTGNLGSGKTLLIKGLCRGLGVKDTDWVKSPTFVLLHLYQGRVPIYHFDLYRLDAPQDCEAIGFGEFLSDSRAVSLVEWADRAPQEIPSRAIWIELTLTGPSSRRIQLKGADPVSKNFP